MSSDETNVLPENEKKEMVNEDAIGEAAKMIKKMACDHVTVQKVANGYLLVAPGVKPRVTYTFEEVPDLLRTMLEEGVEA